jgi:membrane protein implicated in regulation of membrane protease activity
MTWDMFYLVCFLIGVTLSGLSFLSGSIHMPHMHFHFHVPHGHVHIPHGVHVAGGAHGAAGNAEMPVLNFGTITAFLAWFGGTGYLLTRYSSLVVAGVLTLAIIAGIVGAMIVFWFVAKILLKHDRELDPADYERVGVLGRISSPIRAGGTGEIIFSQEGTRHTCGARSESGEALERGSEVVITRYEHGIAYVKRWEELAEEKAATSSESGR